MAPLKGKHVLLTGGSRGVGLFIAKALAKQGAQIALSARSEEGLRNAAESLNEFGVQTIVVPVDLAQESQRHELINTVLKKFGTIDILVNNAGLETEGAFLSLSWEMIRETIEVNFVAPMALTYLVLPHMLKKKEGHIVNISSIGAKRGVAYDATYCGTKAGLAEWTRGLRLELEGKGVHFSTIFPGYVTDVGMFAKFGVASPWMIGSCAPSQVAQAVVRVIENEQLEVIVNSRPLGPVFALGELFPSLGDWLMRRFGVVDFQRKKVSQ